MDGYKPIKFPGWRYGPNGESAIFESEAEVPEGWLDNPNDFKKASKSKKEEGANEAVAKPSEDENVQTNNLNEDAASPVNPSSKSKSSKSKKK